MCKNLLPTELSDFLTVHLQEVQKEKDLLLREYYNENVEEGMDVEDFFKEYTSTIRSYLKTSMVNTNSTNCFPFVIIGSIVEVEDMDNLETYQYYIIPPFSKNSGIGIDNASCLSPLGKALLLKSTDQKVEFEIPAGKLHYVIRKITIPEELIIKHKKSQDLNGTAPQPV